MAKSGDTDAAVSTLERELSRLVQRCKPWSGARWAARAHGLDATRADVAYSLVCSLAAACPETPPETIPPRLRDQALADQLAVVGGELIAWLRAQPDNAIAAALEAAVRKTRDALEPAPLA